MKLPPFLAAAIIGGSLTFASSDELLPTVSIELFATGFTSPVSMVPHPDTDGSFLVAEQTGTVTLLGAAGGKRGEEFLDLRDRMVDLKSGFDERGLLDIAFDPDFEDRRLLYVFYSAPLAEGAPENFNHTGRLSAFTVSEDGRRADPDSERVILTIDEPQFNHDGGCIEFGPDGFLYLGIGDGGGANDTGEGHAEGGNGQALDRLLGKILRIDVGTEDAYAIPPDNPLVGKSGREEIYAWGMRNPWGLTFDSRSDGETDLIVADVGQNRYEEIDLVERGGNYGWPRYEGFVPFDASQPNAKPEADDTAGGMPEESHPPILAYPHANAWGDSAVYGISVTGGQVYRGQSIPALDGVYIFGDWTTSWSVNGSGLFAAYRSDEAGSGWTLAALPGSLPDLDNPQWIVGFARDGDGEVYVLTHGASAPTGDTGAIWKIVPGDGDP